MSIRQFLFLFLLAVAIHASGTELPSLDLTLNYSVNKNICEKAADLLPANGLCRANDNDCAGADQAGPQIEVGGATGHAFERIVDNEYGYTTLAKSNSTLLLQTAIIHINDFQGDKNPRLLETWQVNVNRLADVLAIAPGPIPYEERKTQGIAEPKHLLAEQFSVVLKQGRKISNEWSPVIEIEGHPYAVVRECSGRWVYGGSYACIKVTKVTLLRLSDVASPKPYCQFSKKSRKS